MPQNPAAVIRWLTFRDAIWDQEESLWNDDLMMTIPEHDYAKAKEWFHIYRFTSSSTVDQLVWKKRTPGESEQVAPFERYTAAEKSYYGSLIKGLPEFVRQESERIPSKGIEKPKEVVRPVDSKWEFSEWKSEPPPTIVAPKDEKVQDVLWSFEQKKDDIKNHAGDEKIDVSQKEYDDENDNDEEDDEEVSDDDSLSFSFTKPSFTIGKAPITRKSYWPRKNPPREVLPLPNRPQLAEFGSPPPPEEQYKGPDHSQQLEAFVRQSMQCIDDDSQVAVLTSFCDAF